MLFGVLIVALEADRLHLPGVAYRKDRPALEVLEACSRDGRGLAAGVAGPPCFEFVGPSILGGLEGIIAVQPHLDAGLVLLGQMLAQVDGERGRQRNGSPWFR